MLFLFFPPALAIVGTVITGWPFLLFIGALYIVDLCSSGSDLSTRLSCYRHSCSAVGGGGECDLVLGLYSFDRLHWGAGYV